MDYQSEPKKARINQIFERIKIEKLELVSLVPSQEGFSEEDQSNKLSFSILSCLVPILNTVLLKPAKTSAPLSIGPLMLIKLVPPT